MRVRILRDRRLVPHRRITVAFREGMEVTVKRSWGEALVRSGDAVELPAPPRPQVHHAPEA